MQTKASLDLTNDISRNETLLHESIPLTGSLISGTYGTSGLPGAEPNIKTYTHGLFQSVYDYPYLSSSANHIFDITAGYHPSFSQSVHVGQADKHNIYNQMAFMHVPLDASGNIAPFDQQGFMTTNSTKMKQCVFLNFAKLLVKDEMKRGSFSLELGLSGSGHNVHSAGQAASASLFTSRVVINDAHAAGTNGTFMTNSPAGEYSTLKIYNTTTATGHMEDSPSGLALAGSLKNTATAGTVVGHIYYQTGLVVLTSSIWTNTLLSQSAPLVHTVGATGGAGTTGDGSGHLVYLDERLTGSTIDGVSNSVRHSIYNISFDNTTKLYSTIYYCRANHRQFNYSTNPTYVSGGQIVNKVNAKDLPYAYITTVGLYSSDNELMAVGKFSEPIFKDPTTELVIKARLDY